MESHQRQKLGYYESFVGSARSASTDTRAFAIYLGRAIIVGWLSITIITYAGCDCDSENPEVSVLPGVNQEVLHPNRFHPHEKCRRRPQESPTLRQQHLAVLSGGWSMVTCFSQGILEGSSSTPLWSCHNHRPKIIVQAAQNKWPAKRSPRVADTS